ncbi:MAG: hypothetical protein ACYDHD_05200 [Vulcanimicrobiaceae bacterium]
MNPAIPTDDVVRALLDPSQPSHDPAVQFLQVLLSGFGYNFYDARNHARANDLLVREQTSGLLARAAQKMRGVETQFRARFVPAASREQPLPPAEATRRAKALHEMTMRLDAAATGIVTLESPGADAVWSRVRDELPMLVQLLAYDVGLLSAASALYQRAAELTPAQANADDALDAFDADLRVLDRALDERRALLAATALPAPNLPASSQLGA